MFDQGPQVDTTDLHLYWQLKRRGG